MRQWIYRHLPDDVRHALRPAYYHLRSWQERIWLRWFWQTSRRAPRSFFPALRNYALTTREYLQQRKNSDVVAHAYFPIQDETNFDPPSPKTLGYNPLVHLVVPFNPPLFVAQLHDARVYGDAGDVVMRDQVLLADISFRTPTRIWHERTEHPLLELDALPQTQFLRGTYALLTSRYGGENYFHWMFNVLPRLALLERAGIGQKQFDGLVINRLELPAQNEMLHVLGIPAPRIVEMEKDAALQIESLWVMPSLMTTGHRRRSICNWLREHFLQSADPKPQRRLYLSRADANYRRLANEDEVMAILAPLGFEKIVIGQRSGFEQSALFAQAEIVIAPHSSALANLVFCAPKTRVLDLMPEDRLRTYYWELSACIGLDYYFALMEYDPQPHPARMRGYDTILPVEHLRAMLAKMEVV